MTVTSRRIAVAFEGDGSGVEELSWGQREIWSAMERQRSQLPIGGHLPLPEGRTVEEMAEELRFHMSRHHSMRTRLRFGEDGRAYQVVSSSGEITLEVIEVDGEDPAEVGQQVYQRYHDTPYDYVNDWPMRMAVITSGGVAVHVVAVMHHLVTDGHGGAAMMADLNDRDPVTGEARTPPPAMQPMAQAQWQQGPSGRRQSEQAMRYWGNLLRTIAPRRFAGSDDPREPRHWESRLVSPAMLPAVRIVGERTGADSGTVVLAGFAAAVARITGIRPVVVQPVVSNRFRPGLSNVVSPINQTGLCVFDVDQGTFDELVDHVRRKTLTAYKYAYYDPEQLDALIATVERERGEPVDIAVYFNDRRLRGPDQAGPTPTAEEIRAALDRTTFTWLRIQDAPFERMFLHIEDSPDAIALTLCADTHHVSPADMRACLDAIESVIVAAALDASAHAVAST
jgi:hypothetical protein